MKGLAEIPLFTDDVPGVAAFYRRVVGADPVAEWPGGALFALGDAKLLVHESSGGTDDGPPNDDHLAIAVEDLDAACAALVDAGLALLVGGSGLSHCRSAYLRDPDGRLVELAHA
jgi:catechol 2,3-dioxygenase-like lactoylglutathione lyase family enzyme